MPFIVMRRADIPEASLQVLDLKPNTSNKNSVLEPGLGETKYILPRPAVQDVATSGAGPILTSAEYAGLAAYLIDHVEDSSGTAITAAVANAAALAITAIPATAGVLTLAAVNAALVAAGATVGTGLETGNSTGSLVELIDILAGRVYVLPAGSQVEDAANNFDPVVAGSFQTPARYVNLTGDLLISIGEGNLYRMMLPTFLYLDVSGPAVVVYADDGTIMV